MPSTSVAHARSLSVASGAVHSCCSAGPSSSATQSAAVSSSAWTRVPSASTTRKRTWQHGEPTGISRARDRPRCTRHSQRTSASGWRVVRHCCRAHTTGVLRSQSAACACSSTAASSRNVTSATRAPLRVAACTSAAAAASRSGAINGAPPSGSAPKGADASRLQ
eukprot:5177744-Prymnesium_polylepis.3